MCVCVCAVPIFMYVYIYIYTSYMCIDIHTCLYIYKHVYIFTHSKLSTEEVGAKVDGDDKLHALEQHFTTTFVLVKQAN